MDEVTTPLVLGAPQAWRIARKRNLTGRGGQFSNLEVKVPYLYFSTIVFVEEISIVLPIAPAAMDRSN